MNIALRRATVADVETITAHRRAMFEAMGKGTPQTLDAMCRQYPDWLQPRLLAESYVGWLAVDREAVVAGAGIWFQEWQPHPDNLSGTQAYILNVYTAPRYRGRGLARQLVTRCLNTCRQRGVKTVALHASPAGQPLYRSLGFTITNEMKLTLT